jgi:serine/threonine-protein kinase SRPK3
MLGVDYDISADLWSFACMIFELITGDFLFDPRKGPNYGKTDDHLAQMIELLGPMPHSFALAGKQFDNFFSNEGSKNGVYSFKKIKGLKHYPMKSVLIDKYKFKIHEA